MLPLVDDLLGALAAVSRTHLNQIRRPVVIGYTVWPLKSSLLIGYHNSRADCGAHGRVAVFQFLQIITVYRTRLSK